MDIQPPAARNTDPVTSHIAADSVTRSGVRLTQQKAIAAALKKFPGNTSRELAELIGANRYVVARRLPEIEGIKSKRGEKRECRICRSQCITWWPL